MVPTPTAVVRTELQKRLGGYRPELPHSGDMELWLRLAAHASVGMTETYQAIYRRHDDNMSLGYQAKTWLPDLQQRKAAFDLFYQTCSHALPDAQQLHHKVLRLLSREAVGFASAAFNERKMEVSGQLSEYALDLYPEVKGSLPWTKLACKRRMGYGAWHALQVAIAGIRQVTLPLKRMADWSR